MEEKEAIGLDHEKEYARLQEKIKYEREKITNEWQNRLQSECERTTEIINKLETENNFYKNIIKSILHIS